jgi:CubicO group peptidase (beta-lactamase class C family)
MGVAIAEGYVSGVDSKMLDFFPDITGDITDPRKEEITVRHLLQMRAGYPWEEDAAELWDAMLSGYYIPLIEAFPLVNDPGTDHHYSNLTANWVGIIVDRQSGIRLGEFAEKYIFNPLDIEPGEWRTDADGHNNGAGDLHLNPRDMAKFGQMYLDGGKWEGEQIIPAEYVADSLEIYTEDAWKIPVGPHFKDIGYGYLWWSVRAGDYRYNLAWGHGGQQIALIHDLDMVIVATSYPYWLEHNDQSWRHEKQSLNLVADFIATLPVE